MGKLIIKKEWKGVELTRNVFGKGQFTIDLNKNHSQDKLRNYFNNGFEDLFMEVCSECEKEVCVCLTELPESKDELQSDLDEQSAKRITKKINTKK